MVYSCLLLAVLTGETNPNCPLVILWGNCDLLQLLVTLLFSGLQFSKHKFSSLKYEHTKYIQGSDTRKKARGSSLISILILINLSN